MQDRPATRRWVRSLVARTATRAGLDYTPLVVFALDDWNARVLSESRMQERERRTIRGACDVVARVVYIDLQQERALIRDTVAHEVAHLRWPSFAHRPLFFARVAYLRSGKSLGPKRSRLPEELRHVPRN